MVAVHLGLTEQMTYNGYLLPASSLCLTRNAMRTTLADVAPRNARRKSAAVPPVARTQSCVSRRSRPIVTVAAGL